MLYLCYHYALSLSSLSQQLSAKRKGPCGRVGKRSFKVTDQKGIFYFLFLFLFYFFSFLLIPSSSSSPLLSSPSATFIPSSPFFLPFAAAFDFVGFGSLLCFVSLYLYFAQQRYSVSPRVRAHSLSHFSLFVQSLSVAFSSSFATLLTFEFFVRCIHFCACLLSTSSHPLPHTYTIIQNHHTRLSCPQLPATKHTLFFQLVLS